MSQIDLFLPTVAIGAISFAIASITIAFLIAILLHCIYDLGLRGFINSLWLRDLIYSSMYLYFEPNEVDQYYGMSDKYYFQELVTRKVWDRLSTPMYSLPPAQLSGQISALLDVVLMDIHNERFHERYSEDDEKKNDNIYQKFRSSFEPWLDSFQIKVSFRWKIVDIFLSCFFALAMTLTFYSQSAGASWTVILFIVFFIVIMVPQARVIVERLLRIR